MILDAHPLPGGPACAASWYDGRVLCYGGISPNIRCPCPIMAERWIHIIQRLVDLCSPRGDRH